MKTFDRDVLVSVWKSLKSGQTPEDEYLQGVARFMGMHEDMHPYFEQMANDPDAPIVVDGENLVLHIAMDAATEASLAQDSPAGIRDVMQAMLNTGMDPGKAFHVISQAMMHESIVSSDAGADELDPAKFLQRAKEYAVQACSST